MPLLAHHSFATLYLEEDTIEVEGEVIEFQYQNPHAWVHIHGRDPFGRERHYAAEWASRSRLERDGIKKDTLREGDRCASGHRPTGTPPTTASA